MKGSWWELKFKEGVSCTLWWRRGKSDWIFAVIVSHVFLVYPFQFQPLLCIKRSVNRLIPPRRAVCFGGILTGINAEILVCRNERRVAPIGLDEATLSSPIVCVPYWRVYTHRLSLRIWDSSFLVVGKYPYGHIIHKETASIHQTTSSSDTVIHRLTRHGNYRIYTYTTCWRFQRKE